MDIKQFNYPEPRYTPLPPQQPAASSPPGSSFSIDILRSLRVHALTATLVTLLTFVLGLAVLIRHHLMYAATAVVYVSPTFPATLTPDREQEYPYETYIAEQINTVTRYDVIADALHKLPLGLVQRPGESEELAVSRLQKRLQVGRNGLTYQMFVTLQGGSPEHLAQIVNTITDSYIKKMKGEEFYGRDERLENLKQARDKVQQELSAALKEQDQLSQSLGVAIIGSDSDQLDTQVAKLRIDLTEAHEQRIQAEAQLNSLENGSAGASSPALDGAADEIIASDPSLLALRSSMSQKRVLLLDQLAGLTSNNPLRKTTEEELALTEAGLQKLQTNLRAKAAARLEQKLRTEVRRTSMVEAKLNHDLQSNTVKATTAAPKFQRADELKAQITELQARYAAMDERTRNLELESSSPGSVHMFSPARTPLGPQRSKFRELGIFLIPFSLVMGLSSVVAMDLLDPRVYSPLDIEQALGFSPIGSIFDDRDVTLQAYDECALRLAAGIDQAARNAGVRTVVLSGVHSGAGTTTIVENLGSTLAKLGRKTLAIDASGGTPPVAFLTMGINRPSSRAENGAGNRADDGPHTGLQTGPVIAHAVHSQLAPLTSFMDQAFKDLTKEYDLVLIDAMPLPISAETEYLARFADVTILVTESGKTRKAQLKRASRLLERLNVRGTAAIVNKVGLLRASRAVRKDLEDFEAHVNRMNLRWRRPAEPSGASPVPGFDNSEQPAAKAAREDATYA